MVKFMASIQQNGCCFLIVRWRYVKGRSTHTPRRSGLLWLASALAAVGMTPAQGQTSPEPYTVGNGVSAPRIIYKREPEYAEAAQLVRLEGTVVLSLVVGEDGTPNDLKVIRSLGFGLDEKAIDAVRAWQFAPGQKEGKPVPVIATIETNFRLPSPHAGQWHLLRAVFTSPDGASAPKPVRVKYPPDKLSRVPSFARVTLVVDQHGSPTSIRVEKRVSDPKWEKEFIVALSAWKFEPGMKDGTPVSVPFTMDWAQDAAKP